MPNEPLSRRANAVLAAGTGLLVALTLGTYLNALRLWPWGLDAVRWATRADPDVSRDWTTWVFFSRHFIGWRPVTAATTSGSSVGSIIASLYLSWL